NLLTERGEVGGGVQSLPTEEDRCPVRVPRINSHTVLLSSPREPERPRIGVLPNRLPLVQPNVCGHPDTPAPRGKVGGERHRQRNPPVAFVLGQVDRV